MKFYNHLTSFALLQFFWILLSKICYFTFNFLCICDITLSWIFNFAVVFVLHLIVKVIWKICLEWSSMSLTYSLLRVTKILQRLTNRKLCNLWSKRLTGYSINLLCFTTTQTIGTFFGIFTKNFRKHIYTHLLWPSSKQKECKKLRQF